jgi:glycosyltransferase involved in cell wall biosynthesis
MFMDLELVVVDDSSTDSSIKIIQSYIEMDSRVVVIRHCRNRGVSAAPNSGLCVATGDFISFIYSDDICGETKIQKQIQILYQLRCPTVVYCCCWRLDDEGQVVETRFKDYLREKGMILDKLLWRGLSERVDHASQSLFKKSGVLRRVSTGQRGH